MDMLKIAFLILTLNPEGDVRMTLSDSPNLAACEAKKGKITPVLVDAGYNVLASLCAETDLRLTPYDHSNPDVPLHKYQVEISGGDYTVTPVSDGDGCVTAAENEPVQYCALSPQTVKQDQ